MVRMPYRGWIMAKRVDDNTTGTETMGPDDRLVRVIVMAAGDSEYFDVAADLQISIHLIVQVDRYRGSGNDRMVGHDAHRYRPHRWVR